MANSRNEEMVEQRSLGPRRLFDTKLSLVLMYASAATMFGASIVSLLKAQSKFQEMTDKVIQMRVGLDSVSKHLDSVNTKLSGTSLVLPGHRVLVDEFTPNTANQIRELSLSKLPRFQGVQFIQQFPSVMYNDRPDSIRIIIGEKIYGWPTTGRFVQEITVAGRKYGNVAYPFKVVNSRIVLDVELGDNASGDALYLRNDSLIQRTAISPQIGNSANSVVMSPNNIVIENQDRQILFCLRRIKTNDGIYFKLTGTFAFIDGKNVVQIRDSGYDVIEINKLESDFNRYYKTSPTTNPFFYENGQLKGEVIGRMLISDNAA